MKEIIWKLKAGTMDGQETSIQKKDAGYDYIDKLKDETVINVIDEGDKLRIYLEDNE